MRDWIDLITETSADHRITDEAGNPVIFYHGTAADFEEFDTSLPPRHYETDRGKVFFTSSEENARDYADDRDMWGKQTKPGRVIRAHISMRNPWITDCEESPDAEWDAWGNLYAKEAEESGHDGIIIHTEDGSERLIVVFSPTQIHQIK